jgi:hypothetical protein
VDIFQQWLLLKIQEQFGSGEEPLRNEISFDAVTTLIKPIFEQEDAPLDEDEIRRHLETLTELGYLKQVDGTYFLTFRAIVYANASESVKQMVRDELLQMVRRYGWQALGALVLLIVLLSVIISAVMS